jgi:hypothetical protein
VIIDPAKYQKTARKLIAEEPHPPGVEAAVGEFFKSFVELERGIRALWEGRGFPSLTTRARQFPAFRNMVEDLLLAQVIDAELHSVLLDLNHTEI